MNPARRAYWWLVRRLPNRWARALRATVIFVASGGRRRAFARRQAGRIDHSLIRFTPPKIRLVCIAWGLEERELADVVARVLAVADPSEVVVVADSDAVHLFRRGSCRFEYVPPRCDWESHFPDSDYDAFVAHRIDSLGGAYRFERVVIFGDLTDGLLRGLAGAPAPRAELATA